MKKQFLKLAAVVKEGDEKIKERVAQCTDQRIFAIYQAIKRNLLTVDQIHDITKIDKWFLNKLKNIAVAESSLADYSSGTLLYPPKSFKMVDTCAGEFDAETPYFYSTTSGENEAENFLKSFS